MKKVIIFIILNLTLSVLYANENIFTSSRVALKMINKKDVLFIVLGESDLKIKKSKQLDINFLTSRDTLGSLSCTPFYRCAKEVEAYLFNLGIKQNQSLVLYDNTYGIYASTLYTILESMGHNDMTILRGGMKDIMNLDPNWKVYNKYVQELESLVGVINQDTNESIITTSASKMNALKKKINVLKPYLLVNTDVNINEHNISEYRVGKANKEYLFSKKDLIKLLNEKKDRESNRTLIDVCNMPNIFAERDLLKIKSLPWKSLIDKSKRQLKSNEVLKKLFKKFKLDKLDDNYLYCMSGAEKAFFAMMALREVGYTKVKVFTGDWNTWIGDIDE
ncbi:MAG: Thiosulfate sulfurtransferase, rhodanese [uncultured Sulfurovum sp.]|uniref:Thiosulfate sulfurtransferase, rhodanese n=1 Tax=uncultured Sulfurovum sp. TaxID=269237 RepID=A0A6S6STS5_9BACT|nr:MAG: Thiosulfate sulfurtransferase, rhodanese [uncultured Sulfurovum sp.]